METLIELLENIWLMTAEMAPYLLLGFAVAGGLSVFLKPELVQKYLGAVVPQKDNFYAALNSAVFSDGSFVYVPEGVTCPMELSTYFRINEQGTGQFERTLIVTEPGAYVSYLEGCTAPMRKENQLHAAVVELIAHEDSEIKYSTIQNWYPGNAEGKGGVYNFVTKRGICRGAHSKISWTQLETGSAITWKYPSCILLGEDSVGEFYSVALSNNYQQADTGTKMIHLGKNTKSRIVSKGISAGRAAACGGDALMRLSALKEVQGYNPALIGGEEPEMCLRMRHKGWKVQRIDAEMTFHDAAIHHFSQWWKRSVRAGWAISACRALHGHTAEQYKVKEERSGWLWGLMIPITAIATALPTQGVSLLLLLIYPLLGWKVYRYRRQLGDSAANARLFAFFCILSKFPQMVGQLKYWLTRWRGAQATLIEYKGTPVPKVEN